MPRTGRRRSLSIAAAVIAALAAAPAVAQAATYTVGVNNPGDASCQAPADLACGTLVDAAAHAAPGDVFTVSPGVYEGAHFTVGGITINGAPGVVVNGTLQFSGASGGVAKLTKVALSQATAAAPGIIIDGASGLEVDDSVITSTDGHGILATAGTANKIVRTGIVTGGAATSALRIENGPGSATQALTIESSILIGGAAGIGMKTTCNAIEAACGDITVNARHITAAGSTHGLLLDSSQALRLTNPGTGNITVNLNDSIALNNEADNYPGLATLGANTATITATRSLQTGDPAALFKDPTHKNFRLKEGSPAIGKGGVTAGESATDIDGDDRSVPPTDLGADEYVAPVVTPPPPPPGTVVSDGTPPAVVITRPTANQKIKITTVTTKTTTKTVTKKGKKVKVKVKTKTSKPTKIVIGGTAKDPSGIRGVVLTVEKISTTISTPKASSTASKAKSSQTATAPAQKCKWLNATKGIVLKSCATPILLLAKLAKDGSTWTFSVKSTLKLGAGRYRVIVVGADNSGAVGNSAAKSDAIRLFSLTK